MLRERIKFKLIYDVYTKIESLQDGEVFSIWSLFTSEEWNKYSIEKQRFMISEFQYLVRTNYEDNKYLCEIDFTDLGDGRYKKEIPNFSDNPLEFNEGTSIQVLFHYTQYLVREVLDETEKFQLKDLFPGFIWKRLTQKQKVSLGILFQRYNEDSNQEDYALIAKTKQKQNVYTDLWDRYNWTQSSHEMVDIKSKDFIPDADKLPKIISQTRKLKK